MNVPYKYIHLYVSKEVAGVNRVSHPLRHEWWRKRSELPVRTVHGCHRLLSYIIISLIIITRLVPFVFSEICCSDKEDQIYVFSTVRVQRLYPLSARQILPLSRSYSLSLIHCFWWCNIYLLLFSSSLDRHFTNQYLVCPWLSAGKLSNCRLQMSPVNDSILLLIHLLGI